MPNSHLFATCKLGDHLKKNIQRVFMLIIFLMNFLLATTVFAAETITADSCKRDDVIKAIDLASTGDTVVIPAGDCEWSASVSVPNSKKITLQGAGIDGIDTTTINMSHSGGDINIGESGSRVTGFIIKEGSVATGGDGWRVDHCKFYRASSCGEGVYVNGDRSSAAHPTGLVDNCSFYNTKVLIYGTIAMLEEHDWQHVLWTTSLDLGTNNSVVYVEDCNFEFDVFCNVIDANYGGAYVFRFNHTSGSYIECHSVQGNNRATRRWEIYENTIDNPGSNIYYPYRLRGGTGVVFNDTIVGNWTNYGIALDNIRSYDDVGVGGLCDGNSNWDGNEEDKDGLANGYPCRDQIGRGPDNPQWDHDDRVWTYTQPLVPAYAWGNRSNNALVPFQVINSSEHHIQENRDFYNQTTTFDGTSGVGVGTLANRPSTCTPGVAYWATDQGEWNSKNPGADGQLYKCTSTNTWTLYYTPYTYPHPLTLLDKNDTTPPTRSNASPTGELASGTTETTLSLTTNESATCKYGTVEGIAYNNIANTFSTKGGTSHAATVTGIDEDGQSYDYYCRCKDDAENVNTDDYVISFSVAEGWSNSPPVLDAIGDKTVNEGEAVIFNITAADPDGDTPLYFTAETLPTGAGFNTETQLFGWTPGNDQAGSYEVTFTVSDGELSNSETITITVMDVGTTTPVISNVQSTNSTSFSATISWTTDEPATSQVEYGLTTNYGSQTREGTNLTTSHSVNLTGLSSNTTYHYRVKSKDSSNNEAISSDYTFTTTATDTESPTIPTNLSTTAVSSSQINLTWDASTDNTGVTGYNIYRSSVYVNSTPNTTYSDTGLTAEIPYTYTVSAYDEAGNESAQSTSDSAATLAGNVISAASCSEEDVQVAIDSASAGDTVLVPAGNCTWSCQVHIRHGKKITLQGAGMDSTVITKSGETINSWEKAESRITGFGFIDGYVQVDGDGWRVDHCKFYNASSFNEGVYVFGERENYHPTGLIDNCTFFNARVLVFGWGGLMANALWAQPLNLLSGNNVVYVEDCTFTGTVQANAVDANYGGSYVFRYNTLNDSYIEAQSVQGTHRGTKSWEIYNNIFNQVSRAMWVPMMIRGGTGVVFNNTLKGTWTNPNIALDNVRSCDSIGDGGRCGGSSLWDGNEVGKAGYPCRDQIGRSTDQWLWTDKNPYPPQAHEPVYAWNNKHGANDVVFFQHGCAESGAHIQPGRDYFNNVQKPGYTPYTYPHPLRQAGPGGKPQPPQNLRIIKIVPGHYGD
jgi:chitodextrinase